MQVEVLGLAHFVYHTNKSSQIRLSLAALDNILRRIFFTVLYGLHLAWHITPII
jgi:hypothetical protein